MKWCVKKYVKKKNNKEEPKKISEELFPLQNSLSRQASPGQALHNSITLIVSIRKSWFYAKPYTLLIKKNVKSKFVYVNKNISEKHCACAYHSLVVALFFADLDCASPKC